MKRFSTKMTYRGSHVLKQEGNKETNFFKTDLKRGLAIILPTRHVKI